MTDKIQVYSARGTPSNGVAIPATTTDNAAARWDGATGAGLQDSALIISDLGVITGITANANIITAGQLALARGGTGADLSATGGANHIVKQSSVGGNFSVSALIASDIPALPYVRVEDQKAKNTHGGASTSTTWHTRVLNTEVQDTGGIASVASNQVTLPAGTYDIRISAPGYASSVQAIVLRDDTNGAIVLFGSNEDASSGDTSVTRCWAQGRFTFSGVNRAFSIRHYIAVGVASFGLGVALNVNDPDATARVEVYTVFEAWKVA